MNAVGCVDLQIRLALAFHYLEHPGRAVALGGLGPGGQVDRYRDTRVLQLEVAGLILIVTGVGEINRRELVKAELAIGLGIIDGIAAAGHAQLAVVRLPVQQGKGGAPLGEQRPRQTLLQPVEDATKQGTPAMQGGAEVAGGLQLLPQPALLQRIAVLGQIPATLIAAAQRHGDGFRRQHARFHGGVNALDAGKVQSAGIAADQETTGKVHARQRVPAALGDGAGAVADALASLQGLCDEGMVLEALELVERAEPGVAVVEIDDEPDRHLIALHMIEVEAALTLAGSALDQRPAAAMEHLARLGLIRGHLPQLLEADGIMLRLGAVLQIELGDQLLAQMAAGPFGKQGIAAMERHAGHVIRLGIAGSVQPEIAGDHTPHPSRFHDELACGKTRVYFDSQLLRLLTEPAAEVAQAEDMTAIVVHARRHGPVGQLQGAAVVLQQMNPIIVDGNAKGRLLPAVRQQLLEGYGVEQGAGEQMGADFRSLLQQTDREIGIVLLQGDGGTEPCRAATDDDDIKFHCFAFHLASALDLA